MKTQILNNDDKGIETAAHIIKNGGLVAFPTETVYGLGANAFDSNACLNIFKAKGRASDNPLIVHISDISQLFDLCVDIPQKALTLAQNFWGGPLTLIMKKSNKIPDAVTCNMDTVAIRLPSDKTAISLINRAGVPIAAPSANLSGSPSPVSSKHCIEDLTGRVDAILCGDDCECGVESTILLMTSDTPVLLRPGFVTAEQITELIGEIKIDDAVLNPLQNDRQVLSPGLKYKHYSPKADVIIIDADRDKYIEYVNNNAKDGVLALCFEGDEELLHTKSIAYGKADDGATQAHGLFSALRKADELCAKTVYARKPSECGVGLAVLNRLLRAAGFEQKKL